MKLSNRREKVLKNIRDASVKAKTKINIEEPDLKKRVYNRSNDSLPEMFAKEFNKIQGRFMFCKNENDFVLQFKQFSKANRWKNIFCTEEHIKTLLNQTDLKYKKTLANFTEAEVGVTSCEALVARTGSIILLSGENQSRTMSVYPPIHIVIAFHDQLYFDMSDAIFALKEKHGENYPSMISIVSGPSRTADIEKTLVLGAHGPKDLYCFYINDRYSK